MAITITDVTRVGTAPCKHWRITVNENGQTRQAVRDVNQVLPAFEGFPGGYKEALVLAWMLYQVEVNGLTPNQLEGLEVVA